MEKTVVLTLFEENKIKTIKMTTPQGMEIEVDVITKLPLEEKMATIEGIVNECVNSGFNYFNPLYLRILAEVKVIEACTNIVCEYSDLYAFHDILNANGVFDKILPETEYNTIHAMAYNCAESICKYKNSFMGALQILGSQQQGQEGMNDQIKQILELAQTIKEDADIQEFMSTVAPHLK